MRVATIVGIISTVLMFAVPCLAGWLLVGISSDTGSMNCQIPDTGPHLQQMHVIVESAEGVLGGEFMAQMPGCMTGATYLSDDWVFPVVVGNSQTGVSIGFGACKTGTFHVLTINYYLQGFSDCCPYNVLPHPFTQHPGKIEMISCNFDLVFAMGAAGLVSRWFDTIFENRYPLDGASDQLLDTDLSCTIRYCGCGWEPYVTLYFGTNPNPPAVAWDMMNGFPYDPGTLQPKTTYYWKIAADHETTPLWSFTTEEGVPTRQTSWGAIKELYKE